MKMKREPGCVKKLKLNCVKLVMNVILRVMKLLEIKQL